MTKKKLAVFALIAALVALFFELDLGSYLSFEALRANKEMLSAFYAEHRWITVLAFIVLYVVQTALSLPGAAVFSLAAGLLFGTVLGTIYAVTAATVGALLAFIVARYLFRDTVQKKLGHKLTKFNGALETQGLSYLLFLRLVPVFPFFLVNLGAALTRLPLRTFLFGTLLGILPGGFMYVNAGASLATVNSIGDVVSPRVLSSFALLGIFALAPVLYQKRGKPELRKVAGA